MRKNIQSWEVWEMALYMYFVLFSYISYILNWILCISNIIIILYYIIYTYIFRERERDLVFSNIPQEPQELVLHLHDTWRSGWRRGGARSLGWQPSICSGRSSSLSLGFLGPKDVNKQVVMVVWSCLWMCQSVCCCLLCSSWPVFSWWLLPSNLNANRSAFFFIMYTVRRVAMSRHSKKQGRIQTRVAWLPCIASQKPTCRAAIYRINRRCIGWNLIRGAIACL